MKSIRILFIAIIVFCLSLNHYAQSGIKKDTADYPYWIEMMQDQNVNLFDVQKAFETYWEGREITKGSGWKPFKRWEWWMESRVSHNGERPVPGKTWKAYFKYLDSHPDAKFTNGNWINLGPIHLPSGDKGYKGLGRVNAVAFHPTDANVVYIGAPAGGLWKTADGGSTWSTTTDNLPTLGVSAILVDYTDPDIIYMGTGDRDAGDANGLGVLKSVDGGQNWFISNNGMGEKTVGRMVMHPTNSDMIIAATSGGIYKSDDGGTNWTLKSAGGFKEVVLKPGDPTILYAAAGANFYKSTDTGDTWVQVTSGLTGGQRAVIGVTPASPDYVYCLLTTGDSYKGLYKSVDGGNNFTEMSTTPNIMSWGCEGGSGGQAWYDLDIAVDPLNEDIIYAGGVNCFKSVDGGVNWDIVSHWWGDCGVDAVHADLHILEWNPVDGKLYAGNDGGIYWTDDGGFSWAEITDGLPISQVYRIGQSSKVKDLVINGYQDNGTSTFVGTGWEFTYGGDGMECVVDHEDPDYTYATVYYGDIYRLYNNSGSYHVGGNGSHGINESGGWITPFCLHEADADIMFAGYKNIWKVDGIKGNSFTWEKITDGGGGDIDVVEHSPANNDVFYYSRNNQMYVSENVMDADPSWFDLTPQLQSNEHVRDIEAHPFDENLVYIAQGNKVYKSDNKGMTWTDISGSLPEISMTSLAFYVNSIEGIYVASDAGVYYRDASMNDWIMFSNGLPVDASINEIEIYHNPADPSEDAIRAGTYGRGLWSSEMYQDAPQADFEASLINIPTGCPIDFSDLSFGVPTSWQWSFPGATTTTSTDKNPEGIVYMNEGTYDVTLTVTNSEGTDTKTISGYITVGASVLPVVNFIASDSVACTVSEITFTDLSINCPTDWLWEFTPDNVTYLNGTNQNSQNPEVMFSESGSYSVSLTVTNTAGNITLTKTDYINIGGLSLPFADDFETGLLESKSWTVENPDYQITWDIDTIGGSLPGDKAAWMNFYDYVVPPGGRDRLITPVLNFDGYSNLYLSFDHAYAKRHAYTDSLIVYISDDCGNNWTRIFEGGDDGAGSFATHEASDDPFIPSAADDWCGSGYGSLCNTLDISQWAGSNDIRIMFETYNYFGNNLYIDNVLISNSVDIASNAAMADDISIFPNPAQDELTIVCINTVVPEKIEMYNASGTKVFETVSLQENFLKINLSSFAKGIYFLKIVKENEVRVEKVIVR